MKTYRPIDYRQVCAIARLVFLRTPTMSDAEWKAATLDECARQGWDNPPADMLARAMGAVERSISETLGWRRAAPAGGFAPSRTERVPLTPHEWHAFATTLKAVMERTTATRPANVTPIARETLEISEMAALDQFYAEAHRGDRVAALRRFAEIAIVRPVDWDPKAIRAEAPELARHARECYGCRHQGRTLNWHHIIQIQHGGSNYVRNRVAICDACHSDVHPWLPKAVRASKSGFTHIGGLASGSAEYFKRFLRAREDAG